MKICGISDIHGNLIENIPKCDVLCICGDIVPLNIQREFYRSIHWWKNRFTNWINKLNCKKVIIIPGNHDFLLETLWRNNKKNKELNIFKHQLKELTNNKLEILIDESYYYEGIHFYGTPWINPIEFQENRWAFSSNDHFINIPKCDILLTHENPLKNNYLYNNSYGKYKYHFYGHWHDGDSDVNLKCYNCSRLDDHYNFKKNYKFVILDIMTEKEKKQVEQEFLDSLINEAHNTHPDIEEWLSAYKVINLPQDKEDEVEWNTSAEILDSAVINDMED
jgi:Icc-related predicted phosphoesterase